MNVNASFSFIAELDEKRELEIGLIHPNSGWLVGSGVLTLTNNMQNQLVPISIIKSVEFGELLAITEISVMVTTKRTILPTSPLLKAPTRVDLTTPLTQPLELTVTQKVQKLQERHRLLTLSEPALAEQMRLMKLSQLETFHSHKEKAFQIRL